MPSRQKPATSTMTKELPQANHGMRDEPVLLLRLWMVMKMKAKKRPKRPSSEEWRKGKQRIQQSGERCRRYGHRHYKCWYHRDNEDVEDETWETPAHVHVKISSP